MRMKSLAIAVALVAPAAPALADIIEVKMLNQSDAGPMVFEPAYINAQPGDTIRFLSTDKGHNVEAIKGMLPEGVERFRSPMNKDYDLVVEAEGLYGLKCTPHYAMGMIALVQVGAPVNLDAAKEVRQRGKAAERFEEVFAQVQQ